LFVVGEQLARNPDESLGSRIWILIAHVDTIQEGDRRVAAEAQDEVHDVPSPLELEVNRIVG